MVPATIQYTEPTFHAQPACLPGYTSLSPVPQAYRYTSSATCTSAWIMSRYRDVSIKSFESKLEAVLIKSRAVWCSTEISLEPDHDVPCDDGENVSEPPIDEENADEMSSSADASSMSSNGWSVMVHVLGWSSPWDMHNSLVPIDQALDNRGVSDVWMLSSTSLRMFESIEFNVRGWLRMSEANRTDLVRVSV
ncbi:hypothetical protein H257_02589 [Aphanomyces astaci]|uniref:Uncharacterized protein n=1 Tax=Aphanomyces astaci TaxID=112090 RepID=W4H4F0_APHAT|nr:hypothetical protein H257_02589 [Aphanomyces astaci]ETV86124.1 hypothetical protein H257_02589 [Aphanomyces astaci]|eukprot:XP_009824596.1 hypothetical protein H257_02589 [Aphanomyces astaci]